MPAKRIVGAIALSDLIRTAPLGALLRYSDGQPRPPVRFNKKLAAWERTNGVGRLIKKTPAVVRPTRSEEHTSELQSLMRISYAVFCLKKKKKQDNKNT